MQTHLLRSELVPGLAPFPVFLSMNLISADGAPEQWFLDSTRLSETDVLDRSGLAEGISDWFRDDTLEFWGPFSSLDEAEDAWDEALLLGTLDAFRQDTEHLLEERVDGDPHWAGWKLHVLMVRRLSEMGENHRNSWWSLATTTQGDPYDLMLALAAADM